MPIRLSGMASGMDTEAMISELVSAYKLKSQKYVKAQKKLSYKQDKWSTLNKQVKSFYSTLTNMRLSSAYNLKAASISDATKATVSAGSSAVNGSYTLKIDNTAKTGYVTGSNLGSSITKDSTLADLGITGNSTISVTTGGVANDIQVTSGMKVSEFVDKLSAAGVKASYDEANHRIYVAAKDTGVENDFSLSGSNAGGVDALTKLGLSVSSSANIQSYKDWAAYAQNTSGGDYFAKDSDGKFLTDSTGKYITNGTYDAAATQNNISNIRQQMANDSALYTNNMAQISYARAYQNVSDVNRLLTSAEQSEMQTLMAERDLTNVYLDNGGNIYDKLGDGTFKSRTDGVIHNPGSLTLTEGATRLADLEVTAGLATVGTDADGNITYTVNGAAVDAYKNGLATIAAYDDTSGAGTNASEVAAVQAAYSNGTLSTLTGSLQAAADAAKKFVEENKLVGSDTQTATSIAEKITHASGVLDGTITESVSPGATRVNGTDAEIWLNGAFYTSSKNDFTINGLNISALASTNGSEVTINVANNAQGLYDKIKDTLKQYNTLIVQMTGSYNAKVSKGFEPLTNEEKDAMSDSEVEEWEKKIKDSVLRRDDTLEFLMGNMQTAMLKSYKINGKDYNVSSFGISTLGVLNSNEHEERAFHINGDKDDTATAGKTDKLMEALTNDPDTVTAFMQQLTSGVYDVIKDKMNSTTLSSFDVVYNDKEMAKEYSDYTTTIKKWEEKVAKIEESYYKKFAAMESALATLQSKQSSLSSLLGS